MSFAGPDFVLAIIGLSTAGWVATTWIRARHGYPVENEWSGTATPSNPEAERRIADLTRENAEMAARMEMMVDRLAVLERIVTDPARRTAREIEELR